MNKTYPRCTQCGENPRIRIDQDHVGVSYHPLCQECHLELREQSYRKVGSERLEAPKRPINLPELLAVKTRFFSLGLATCSIIQLPVMFLSGSLAAVIAHSILIAVFGPSAVVGFLIRRKP